jgi:hypothetical protein
VFSFSGDTEPVLFDKLVPPESPTEPATKTTKTIITTTISPAAISFQCILRPKEALVSLTVPPLFRVEFSILARCGLEPEDDVEGSSEIYYFVDEGGNIHLTPPEVIEIHPPFDDYCCSIDHFLDIYGTFEKGF